MAARRWWGTSGFHGARDGEPRRSIETGRKRSWVDRRDRREDDFGQAGVMDCVEVSEEAKRAELERAAVHDGDRVVFNLEEGGAEPHGGEPEGEADGAAEDEGGDGGGGDVNRDDSGRGCEE